MIPPLLFLPPNLEREEEDVQAQKKVEEGAYEGVFLLLTLCRREEEEEEEKSLFSRGGGKKPLESRAKEKEIDDGAGSKRRRKKTFSFFFFSAGYTFPKICTVPFFGSPSPPLSLYLPTHRGGGGPSPPRVEREKGKSAQHSSLSLTLFPSPFPLRRSPFHFPRLVRRKKGGRKGLFLLLYFLPSCVRPPFS